MTRKAFFIADLLPGVADAARKAATLIMTHYKNGGATDRKADASPVTEADRAADRLIVAALKKLAPEIPVVSEEGDKPDVSHAEYFWLVDPLDGTKSFIRGSGYFTVNIGLIYKNVPVLGVICEPVSGDLYTGLENVALKNGNPIRVRCTPEQKAAFVSHSHLDRKTLDFLAAHNIDQRIPCASSIKFCFLAAGKADLYPRFGPTMEWDTAAGHAILLAAGGNVMTPEGTAFMYGKKGFLNGNFVASG